jgi:uncharacterized MAPEG superfamily protein
MTTELALLLGAVAFGLLQCLATGLGVNVARGVAFGASPRDDQAPIGGVPGRIIRAYANFMETFPFFVAVVLAAELLDRHSSLTVVGAELYFWGRLAYWPLYVGGVPWVRSLAWTVATAGIVVLLIGVAYDLR